MKLQYLNYIIFLIFLLGLCSVACVKKFLSILISIQIILVSATLNFYSFSLFLYSLTSWDKIFVFFGLLTIYIFLILIVFYNYFKQTGLYQIDVLKDLNLFKLSKSDWWGEDNN